jgi:urease accessory protein
MDFIHAPLAHVPANLPKVSIVLDRHTLAKRRWRGVAGDGREFGFDLEAPLKHGDFFFASMTACYLVKQQAEPVLELDLANDPAMAAKVGWTIGNLHFPMQIEGAVIRVADDPALRQLFEREGFVYRRANAVFLPLTAAVPHSHAHGHGS